MSGMDVLLDLPEALSALILSQWINIEELYKVDTAYCHHAKRQTLREIYKCEQLLLSNEACTRISFPVNFIPWCTVRKIKFSEFHLTSKMADFPMLEGVVEFLAITGHTLTTFDSHNNVCPPVWMFGLAMYSSQLKFLSVICDPDASTVKLGKLWLDAAILRSQHCLRELMLAHGFTSYCADPDAASALRRLVMKTLNISGPVTDCDFDPAPSDLSDSLPQLIKLELSVYVGAGLDAEKMLSSCPKLQHLALTTGPLSCAPVTVLRALNIHSHPHLQSLTLRWLVDQDALALPGVCPQIPDLQLKLAFAANITPHAFSACVLGCKNIVHLTTQAGAHLVTLRTSDCAKTLTSLHLYCWGNSGVGMNADDLAVLLSQCISLTELSLRQLDDYCGFELERIVRAVPPAVRVLTLHDVAVDNAVLLAVGECLPQLQTLHLYRDEDYESFDEAGLLHLAQHCKQLRTLRVGSRALSVFSIYLWQQLYPPLRIYTDAEEYFGYDEVDGF